MCDDVENKRFSKMSDAEKNLELQRLRKLAKEIEHRAEMESTFTQGSVLFSRPPLQSSPYPVSKRRK